MIVRMRLPERFKQTVYVSNETFFGSGEWETPYPMRAIVTPKSDRSVYGGGVVVRQNNIEIKFESNLKDIELITQNSKFWVKRIPNPTQNGGDFTHETISRDLTTNQQFVVIECRSATDNFPLI